MQLPLLPGSRRWRNLFAGGWRAIGGRKYWARHGKLPTNISTNILTNISVLYFQTKSSEKRSTAEALLSVCCGQCLYPPSGISLRMMCGLCGCFPFYYALFCLPLMPIPSFMRSIHASHRISLRFVKAIDRFSGVGRGGAGAACNRYPRIQNQTARDQNSICMASLPYESVQSACVSGCFRACLCAGPHFACVPANGHILFLLRIVVYKVVIKISFLLALAEPCMLNGWLWWGACVCVCVCTWSGRQISVFPVCTQMLLK